MPSEALMVAGRRLPVRLKEALEAEQIAGLEDAIASVENTYKIWPEEKSAEISELHRRAAQVLVALTAHAEAQLVQKLGSCGRGRQERLVELTKLSSDAKRAGQENLRFVAAKQQAHLWTEIRADLNHLLAESNDTDQATRLREVIQSKSNDPAVVELAERNLSELEAVLKNLLHKEASNQAQGEVSVASALIGLRKQLPAVMAVDADFLEQQEILNRATQLQELAGARGVEWDDTGAEAEFDLMCNQIKAVVEHKKEQAAAEIEQLLAQVPRMSAEVSDMAEGECINELEYLKSLAALGTMSSQAQAALEEKIESKAAELRDMRAARQLEQDLSLIHISEPTRLLSISYAVFCLKKKKKNKNTHYQYSY
eukprot:TRINITY_DN10983_c0_g2_i3.p1 TRINITY_DN10983_c0_g2~~TRINITY_DN10983_c0_g2_i3.p1  ORF type:complete len:370 (+),score=122.38 TRINITY_DN10983_c0_g2_i3:250-1359(+)